MVGGWVGGVTVPCLEAATTATAATAAADDDDDRDRCHRRRGARMNPHQRNLTTRTTTTLQVSRSRKRIKTAHKTPKNLMVGREATTANPHQPHCQLHYHPPPTPTNLPTPPTPPSQHIETCPLCGQPTLRHRLCECVLKNAKSSTPEFD